MQIFGKLNETFRNRELQEVVSKMIRDMLLFSTVTTFYFMALIRILHHFMVADILYIALAIISLVFLIPWISYATTSHMEDIRKITDRRTGNLFSCICIIFCITTIFTLAMFIGVK